MHSPKVQEQDLMMQLIKNQESLNPNGNGKIIGG
jgi:hypothetical protein